MIIRKSIRVALAASDKKVTELADYCGVSQPAISNYIRGATSPTFSRIEKIAEFFEMTPSEFIKLGE